jgi:hypothetical protein
MPRQTDKTDIVFLYFFYYVALDFFAGLWDNKYMRVDLFEENGIWEADVFPSIGKSINYSNYKTAGDAINHLLSVYPAERLNVGIFSTAHHNKLTKELK